MQAETSERRDHGASINVKRLIIQAFTSAFNHAIPFTSIGFIAIPFVIFGMFSMGLNPEDSQLRTGYYLLVTAVPALSIIVGFAIGMLKWRRAIHVVLTIAIGFAAFLCYLWFYARVSIVPVEPPSQFVGWHWSSNYQYFLLLVFIMLLSVRCGMTFKREKAGKSGEKSPPNQDRSENSIKEGGIIIAISIIAGQYLASWLAGWWYMLFLSQACIEMAGGTITLWTSGMPERESNKTADQVLSQEQPRLQALIILSLPFLLLAQGFDLGLAYIVNNWTSAWLASFAWTFGFAALTIFILEILKLRYPSTSIVSPVLFIGVAIMLTLAFFFETRLLMPMDILFWVASGIAAGLLVSGLKSMMPARRHPFHAILHVMLSILFISLGIGIGLAYYLYEPYGDEIIALVIPAFEIIAFVVVSIHIIVSRAIKKKIKPVAA